MDKKDHQSNELTTETEIPPLPILDEKIRHLFISNFAGSDGFSVAFHIVQKMEKALHDMEHYYRGMLDSIKDVIFRVDRDGNLIFINPSWEQQTGFSIMESLSRQLVDFVHAEDRQVLLNYFERISKSYGAEGNLELRWGKKSGAYFWVDLSARLITDMNGEIAGITGTLRDITEQKQAAEKIHLQIERLSALKAIDLSIASSLDLNSTLAILLEHITTLMNVDAANVFLYNKQQNILETSTWRGFRYHGINNVRLKPGENFAGMAAAKQEIIFIKDLRSQYKSMPNSTALYAEGFVSYFAIPLVSKGNIKGVLEVFHRSSLAQDEDWMEFLKALATQMAIAIDNAELFVGMQRSNIELVLAYDETIEGWSKALDLRDKETEGHTQRVTEMTVNLAASMGFDSNEIVHIRRGSLLHDIGKLAIPDYILLKPGTLTAEEWDLMKKHPLFAHEMLSSISFLRQSLDIPCFHHEKWDGTGYPYGLKGETIPVAARIFALVDVWDAITSSRPYRLAWTQEDAIKYIQSLSGTHFDPSLVGVFVDFIKSTVVQ
ncbi:MAG: PAS domain S-box protein [Anaerolineales bacterium]